MKIISLTSTSIQFVHLSKRYFLKLCRAKKYGIKFRKKFTRIQFHHEVSILRSDWFDSCIFIEQKNEAIQTIHGWEELKNKYFPWWITFHVSEEDLI